MDCILCIFVVAKLTKSRSIQCREISRESPFKILHAVNSNYVAIGSHDIPLRVAGYAPTAETMHMSF